MNKKEKEVLFASRLPGILNYHQKMLADGVRNKLLYEAIKNHVTGETSFLDIGAGTGVWAILAAKLGAKRVVAIEIEECLIPIIYRHAQENGVADKIEIIHGNSDNVKIRGKFDVIVSELFSGDAMSEATTKSFVSLRNRFLAKNGVLIPQKLAMQAVPVYFQKSIQQIPAELPITCNFLKQLKLNYNRGLSIEEQEKIEILAEPKSLVEIDFETIKSAPSLKNLSASWKMEDLSKANAIVVFGSSIFAEGIVMNSLLSQSWTSMIYEFQPFTEDNGEIQFNVTMDGVRSVWSVSENSGRTQNYSPTFPPPRIRMTQQTTPYRKVKAPKNLKTNQTPES